MAEEHLRRTPTISQGDPVALLACPSAIIAHGLLAVILVSAGVPRWRRGA